MKKIFTIIIVVGLLLSYFTYVSYFSLDVTTYSLNTDKVNGDIKVVMISDLHDTHCLIQEKIVEKINQLKPNIILCVGDMIDKESTNDQNTLEFLKELNNISDVYVSLGNHEVSYLKIQEFINHLQQNNIHFLEEDYQDIVINNNTIRIGGMYLSAYGQTKGEISKKDMHNNSTYRFLKEYTASPDLKIMMAHRPDSFIYHKARNWDIDLVLSGHTHGGQVVLPFIGGLYAPEQKWFPEFDYGHYQLNKMNLIITRGLASGNQIIPRFNNKPEIVQIKIQGN